MKNISAQLKKISENEKIIAFKAKYGKRKFVIPAIIIFLLIFLSIFLVKSRVSSNQSTASNETETPTPTLTITPEPTATDEASITQKLTPTKKTLSPTIKLTPSPSVSPTKSGSPTSTPVPTNTSTPYVPLSFYISYPTENQVIEANAPGDRICIVDLPNSAPRGYGDVVKRENINGGGWSGYTQTHTTCYDPAEGANTVELQYKDTVHNDETQVYTRHYVYHHYVASPTETPVPSDTPVPTPTI